MQGTHANLNDMFCGTKDTWDRLCISNRVPFKCLSRYSFKPQWMWSCCEGERSLLYPKESRYAGRDAGFKFNNIWRHTKTFEDLICSSSLAGGLQQQSIYFTAVHILLSLKAFLGNFLILVVKIKVFIYTTGDCIDSFFVISGSTTDSKKIYVVVTCTLPHGFIIIIIFFIFILTAYRMIT